MAFQGLYKSAIRTFHLAIPGKRDSRKKFFKNLKQTNKPIPHSLWLPKNGIFCYVEGQRHVGLIMSPLFNIWLQGPFCARILTSL